MSEENVERVRRTHQALNQSTIGPEEIHSAAVAHLHPDVEWHDQRELPGATVHRGIEEVEQHLAAAREALDYYATDLLETLDAGPCVVAAYRFHARGRYSGVSVERDAVYVYRFRGAKIDCVEIFGTRAEALKAAGLEG